MRLSTIVSTFSLLSATYVTGAKIPVTRRALDLGGDPKHPVSVTRVSGDKSFGFTHASNQGYTATLYVNGVPFQCILDTGSSDTWIDTTVGNAIVPPGMFYTGVNSSTDYADGTHAPGPLMLVNATWGPYTVQNQAIMIADGVSPIKNEISGLIGLSMYQSSNILSNLANTTYAASGIPLLLNIFIHNQDQPNYFTFLMDRGELGVTDGGVLTVSELVTEYEAVTSAPKLPVIGTFGWSTFLDGMSVNGKMVTGDSALANVSQQAFGVQFPSGKTLATLDTGTSWISGPKEFVDAAYKNIPGAVPTNDTLGAGPGYIIPCDTKLNLTFYFAGNPYPMHPIDAVVLNTTADGIQNCLGAITVNENPMGLGTDWLIGDSFMRNIYSLYDYGNQTSKADGNPYMQILSIVNADAAWAETDALMLKRLSAYQQYFTSTYGVTPTTTQLAYTGPTYSVSVTSADNKQTFAPYPTVWAGSAQPSSSNAALSGALAEDAAVDSTAGGSSVDLDGLTRNSYIIIGLLAAALILLIVVAAFAVRANRANKGYRAVPTGGMSGGAPPKFVDPYNE
ncbi:aspartic peptidase domain-containing protein [Cubamyces lactineus]|nr:aspartic peptidase domain-containing protein [Cubamyces lactineus]